MPFVQRTARSRRPPGVHVEPPDPACAAHHGPDDGLAEAPVPWRGPAGAATMPAPGTMPSPESPAPGAETAARKAGAPWADPGAAGAAIAAGEALAAAIARDRRQALVARAENSVPAPESCRDWPARRVACGIALMAGGLVAAGFLWPAGTAALLTMAAVLFTLLATGLKSAAAVCMLRDRAAHPRPARARAADPPRISLLVPLFDERRIAGPLLERLSRIDYPRDRLDVCLVLEADDDTTLAALRVSPLPAWIRAVVVPAGTIRTKPRAMNYALDFCDGEIVGVYDAEDAPAPDQLLQVAERFAAAAPDVACLQGRLDYYNSRANWLTRCFTLEYNTWFRIVLPGLARLGLVVPLGGTTLFFRRDILERLGRWDAHNVTEDADLGLRLARHGYRTELLDSTTEEEANGRAIPWIRQRSRWLKGYAITWAVHMRHPARLWQELGGWRFAGVQVLFLGTICQLALAPVLWSFAAVPLGLPHPLLAIVPVRTAAALAGFFLTAEAVNLLIAVLAARRADKAWLAPWALTLPLYFALPTVAIYKALAELAWRPFYWDKTAHGILAPDGERAATPPPPRPARRASAG